jgi:hypothetical protein
LYLLSSVGIATGYGLDNRGEVEVPVTVRSALEPTLTHIHWVPKADLPGGRAAGS